MSDRRTSESPGAMWRYVHPDINGTTKWIQTFSGPTELIEGAHEAREEYGERPDAPLRLQGRAGPNNYWEDADLSPERLAIVARHAEEIIREAIVEAGCKDADAYEGYGIARYEARLVQQAVRSAVVTIAARVDLEQW